MCFADYDQEPDYENKRGKIVDFEDVPLTEKLKKKFAKVIGEKGRRLMGEALRDLSPSLPLIWFRQAGISTLEDVHLG